jgi:hypothetical protein
LNIERGCFGTIGGQHVGLVNLAIDSTLFFLAALQVDEATVRTVLNSGGLAQNLRRATASGRPETPHSISLIIPAGSPRLAS